MVKLALVVAAIAGSFVGIAAATLSDKGRPSSSYIPASSTVVTDDPSDPIDELIVVVRRQAGQISAQAAQI
ncbi:MAG TPA: hypothetical protein VNT27_15600, partial [Propionibacteriaceae bacterium]|nr:hypothetical protein [Propionibacteriaceae bacterium]